MSSTLTKGPLFAGLTGLAAASFGLAACSSSPTAAPAAPASTSASSVPANPATPATPKTLITGETLKTETAKPSRTESTGSKTSNGSGQANSGFDGPTFQTAMAALSIPATSTTAGSLTTGAGTMSYTMSGTAQGIGRIDCFVKAQGSSDGQSDQHALALSNPFLESCGSYSQYGDLKTQAGQYVQTNLPKIQGESMQTTTVGAIELKVGRAGPGNYFVTIVNGG